MFRRVISEQIPLPSKSTANAGLSTQAQPILPLSIVKYGSWPVDKSSCRHCVKGRWYGSRTNHPRFALCSPAMEQRSPTPVASR